MIFTSNVVLGKMALVIRKEKGDKAPKGLFNIEHLYYRADKFINLKTALKN